MSYLGRHNLTQLASLSHRSRRTLTRLTPPQLPYAQLNHDLLASHLASRPVIAAIDCSFIPKSGSKTEHLGSFWNGSHSRPERGLEICSIAICTLDHPNAYSLVAAHTPARCEDSTRMDFDAQQVVEQAHAIGLMTRYLVADGAFANQTFFDKVCATRLDVVTKLKTNANLV